jgi:hypothetical protein
MAAGEIGSKCVLVDGAVIRQDAIDGARHLGVVRPLPWAGWKSARGEGVTIGRDEELGTEGVAESQAME